MRSNNRMVYFRNEILNLSFVFGKQQKMRVFLQSSAAVVHRLIRFDLVQFDFIMKRSMFLIAHIELIVILFRYFCFRCVDFIEPKILFLSLRDRI